MPPRMTTARHDHGTHGHRVTRSIRMNRPLPMLIPLGVLAIGALFAGLVFSHDFIGEGAGEFWKGALYLGPDNQLLEAREDIPELRQAAPHAVDGLRIFGRGVVLRSGAVDSRAARRRLSGLSMSFFSTNGISTNSTT